MQHLVLAQLKLGTVPQSRVDNVESLVLCPLATSLGAVEPRGWGLGQPPAGSICQSWEEESEYIYISTSPSKQPPSYSSLAKVLGVKPQVFKSFPPFCISQYWGVSQVAKVVLRHTLIRLFSWTALSRSSTFPPSSNCITGTVVNFMALGRAPAQVTDIYSSGLRHRSNCPS